MVPFGRSETVRRLTGRIRVPRTGEEAFRLFTPVGERLWSPEWDPQFMAPVEDDSAPGTVWRVSHGDEPAVWIACRREPWRLLQYARVIPSRNAGTVTVSLEPLGTESVVRVEYHLTALSDDGCELLDHFAASYDDFLASWERAISEALRR
jgi:hypothetical protein